MLSLLPDCFLLYCKKAVGDKEYENRNRFSYSLFLVLAEETEVYTAVCDVPEEVWMLAEIIILAMFKDKHTSLFQQITVKHKIGNTL